MKNNDVLLAVLAGIAAGALIGVLVVPKKTRVKDNISGDEDYFGHLKDRYSDMLQRLNAKLDALKEEFDGYELQGRH